MKRRNFITLLGGAAVVWPLAAHGQQTPEVPRVGFVYAGSKAAAALRIEAILSGLRGSGYAAPAQVEIVARTAEGDPAQIAPLVAEVIAKNVNVIIVNAPRYCTQLIWPRAPFRLSHSTWKLTQSPVVWLLVSRVQAATSPVYFSTFQTSRRSAWRCWLRAIQRSRVLRYCGIRSLEPYKWSRLRRRRKS